MAQHAFFDFLDHGLTFCFVCVQAASIWFSGKKLTAIYHNDEGKAPLIVR